MPRDRMKLTVELVKKGATILGEPCQTCGGVQVKYRGMTYCTGHDNLSSVLSEEEISFDSVVASLKHLLLSKLTETIGLLEKEKDQAKQDQLLSLMTKYFDLLQKLPQK